MNLGFIGAGRVGTALAVRLSRKGYPVSAVYDLQEDAARAFADEIADCTVMSQPQDVANSADFVFVSTPDALIEPVASSIKWETGQTVVHCSGANTVALLDTAKKAGALVGVFHPGQTFADTKQAIENMAGATFDIEAEEPLLTTFKKMAGDLDGYWIEVRAEDKAVYHVAVELTSLFVMLLFRTAVKMMKTMDITVEQAIRVALPMLRGTANIIETFGNSRPLTGPVDRGDDDTIKRHIDGLNRLCPGTLPLYRELVRQNIPFAVEHDSIDQEKSEALLALINEYGNHSE